MARRNGVARQTVHDWLRAYAGRGMAALVPQGERKPSTKEMSPGSIPEEKTVDVSLASARAGG